MRSPFTLAVGLIILFFLTGPIGCSTLKTPGFPEQSYDDDKEIKQLQDQFAITELIKKYFADCADEKPDDPNCKDEDIKEKNQSKEKRDEIITTRLLLIDKFYNRFIRDFSSEKQGLDTFVDVAVIGIDLAVATVGGAATKSALGAASAGLTGSKLSFDKNFYFEKTISVLITAMNAQRKVALIPIRQKMPKDIDEYSLQEALSHLESYYLAGTFIGALQGINEDAAAKGAKAKLDLAAIRTTDFMDDKWGRAIQTFWMPGQPIDLTVNKANQKILEDWMKVNGIEGVPLQVLITGAAEELAKLRKKAVQDLKIPVN